MAEIYVEVRNRLYDHSRHFDRINYGKLREVIKEVGLDEHGIYIIISVLSELHKMRSSRELNHLLHK